MNSAFKKVNGEDNSVCKDESAWLSEFRLHHYELFKEHGLPNQKNEYWKYTDLTALKDSKITLGDHHDSSINHDDNNQLRDLIERHRVAHSEAALLVMVDGSFSKELSQLKTVTPGVLICSLRDALKSHEELVKKYWSNTICIKKFPFACMNAAVFNDGLFIHVAEKTEMLKPIHLLSIMTGTKKEAIHPRHLIIVDNDSSIKLYEEFVAMSDVDDDSLMINTATSITLEQNAKLSYVKILHNSADTFHLNYCEVQQQKNSELTICNFLLGAHFAREDLIIDLKDKYAKCNTCGFYQSSDNTKYHDHHIIVNHIAPNTDSNMLFKGILHHKARAVFNGRVCVDREANKISAYQANHNLIMEENAEIYSKPELEIYADDVKCKHASTTGQFDPDVLFYLRSRGISLTEAKRIMVRGFAQEVIEYVDDDYFKTHIEKMV